VKKKNLVISMNRYGKPRNDNYMVNVCVIWYLLSTHNDSVTKIKCVKKLYK